MLHLSWISQRARQDHPPEPTPHLRRREDLSTHRTILLTSHLFSQPPFKAQNQRLQYLHVYFASFQKKSPLQRSPLSVSQTWELLCLQQIEQKVLLVSDEFNHMGTQRHSSVEFPVCIPPACRSYFTFRVIIVLWGSTDCAAKCLLCHKTSEVAGLHGAGVVCEIHQ